MGIQDDTFLHAARLQAPNGSLIAGLPPYKGTPSPRGGGIRPLRNHSRSDPEGKS